MANCLSKKKESHVELVSANVISEVRSKGTALRPDNPSDPADMKKSRKQDEILTPEATKKLSIMSTADLGENRSNVKPCPEDQLTREATQKRPVVFTVELDDDTQAKSSKPKKPQMPKRLAERLAAEKEPKCEFEYTNEEECLMADIMREEKLKKVKEKAAQEDIKVYDAQRKRLALEKCRGAQLEEKPDSSTPVAASDPKQRLKELAEEDKMKAAERKNVQSFRPVTATDARERLGELAEEDRKKVAERKNVQRSSPVAASEARQRVQELAEADRKAVERKKASLQQ